MAIQREEMQEIADGYKERPRIGIFGSHSAIETGIAAKRFGLETVLAIEEGRSELYDDNKHLYDDVIRLQKFKELLKPDIQQQLVEKRVLLLPNRSFSVYVGVEGIENEFRVPIYGNRWLLRAEERTSPKGQRWLLQSAGIRMPRQYENPEDIDGPVIVKVQDARNPLERAFFKTTSPEGYEKKVQQLRTAGVINDDVLAKSTIEELVTGALFNANFHAYSLQAEFGLMDFVGFSDRIQANLSGIVRLPAKDQLELEDMPITNEEVGHMGVTMRESLKPQVYAAAKELLTSEALLETYPPGIIGPFGLQGGLQERIVDGTKKLEFVVFDLSPRIPGDPAIGPTSPEMANLTLKHRERGHTLFNRNDPRPPLAYNREHGLSIEDPLDLAMMEILHAHKEKLLGDIVT
jgi:5-formaminoimidazole-4-carboxamide-1-(beta)-D-ribofuranosyl 5'-monophosphate synthetase